MDNDDNKARLHAKSKETPVEFPCVSTSSDSVISSKCTIDCTDTKKDISCDSSSPPTPATQLQDSTASLERVGTQRETAEICVSPFANQHLASASNPPPPFTNKLRRSISNPPPPFANQPQRSTSTQLSFTSQHPCQPLSAEPQTSSTLPTSAAEPQTSTTTFPTSAAQPLYFATSRLSRSTFVVLDPVTSDGSNFAQNEKQDFLGLYTLSTNPDGTVTAHSVNPIDASKIPSFQCRPKASRNVKLPSDKNEQWSINEVTEKFVSESIQTTTADATFTETNNSSSKQGLPLDISESKTTLETETQTDAEYLPYITFTPISSQNQASNTMSIPLNCTSSQCNYAYTSSDATSSDIQGCTNYDPSSPMELNYQTQNTQPIQPTGFITSRNPDGSLSMDPIYQSYIPPMVNRLYVQSYEYNGTTHFYHVQLLLPQYPNQNPAPLLPVNAQQSHVPVFETYVQDQALGCVEQQYYGQHFNIMQEQVASPQGLLYPNQATESTVLEDAYLSQDSSFHHHQATESTISEKHASLSQDSSLNQHQATESAQDSSLYQHQTESTILDEQAALSQDSPLYQNPATESTILVEQTSLSQDSSLYQHQTESTILVEQASLSQDSSLNQHQATESTILDVQAALAQDSSLYQHQTESTVLEEHAALSEDSLNQHQATEYTILEEQLTPNDVAWRRFFPKQSWLVRCVRIHASRNAQMVKFLEKEDNDGNQSSAVNLDAKSSISENPSTELFLAKNSDGICCTETSPVALNIATEQRQATEVSGAALDSPLQKQTSNISMEKGETSKTVELVTTYAVEDCALKVQMPEEMQQSHPAEKDVQLEAKEKKSDVATESDKEHVSDGNDLEKLTVIPHLKESTKGVEVSRSDVGSDNPISGSAVNLPKDNSISNKINAEKKECSEKDSSNIRKKSSKSEQEESVTGAIKVRVDKNEKLNVTTITVYETETGGATSDESKVGGAIQDYIRAFGYEQALALANTIKEKLASDKKENPHNLRYQSEGTNDLNKKTETALNYLRSANNHSSSKQSLQKLKSNSRKSPRQTRLDRKRSQIRSCQWQANLPVDPSMGTSFSTLPAGQVSVKPGKDCKVTLIKPQSKKGVERLMFATNATTLSARVARGDEQPTERIPEPVLATLRKNQKSVGDFLRNDDSANPELEKTMYLLKETKEEPEKEEPKPEVEPVSASSTSKRKKKNKKR